MGLVYFVPAMLSGRTVRILSSKNSVKSKPAKQLEMIAGPKAFSALEHELKAVLAMASMQDG